MRFVTGARARSLKLVVRPSRTINDLSTGLHTQTPSLRVEFKDHKFDSDSEAAKQMYREYAYWTEQTAHPRTEEEIQEMVETYIQRHPDWNRGDGRGIFIDQSAKQRAVELAGETPAGESGRHAVSRCLYFQEVGSETIQCENPALDDDPNQLCATHSAEAMASV